MLWRYKQETVNPARLGYIVPDSFTHAEYMHICIPLLETCDGIYMLRSWFGSKGATMELNKAMELGLTVMGHATIVNSEPVCNITPNLRLLNDLKQEEQAHSLKIGQFATVNIAGGRFDINTSVKILGITDPDTDPQNVLVQNADGNTLAWYREEDLLISGREKG